MCLNSVGKRNHKLQRENREWWWQDQIKLIYGWYLDLAVKRLCCINSLNIPATNFGFFQNQKLCCDTAFLDKNDENKNSSGL